MVLALDAVCYRRARLHVLAVLIERRRHRLEILLLLSSSERGTPYILGLCRDVQKRRLYPKDAVLALLDQGVLLTGVRCGGERTDQGRRAAGASKAIPARVTRVGSGARRRGVGAAILHLLVDIVDGRLGADEAFKVGLHKDLERCRFLIDRPGQGLETGDQRLRVGRRVHLGEEQRRRECGGREKEAIACPQCGVSPSSWPPCSLPSSWTHEAASHPAAGRLDVSMSAPRCLWSQGGLPRPSAPGC